MNSKEGDFMATKAKLEGNKKHQDKLDRIIIQPYEDEGKAIRSAAVQAGESLQGYVLKAIRQRMESEK